MIYNQPVFFGLKFAISEMILTLVNHDLGDLPTTI